MAASEMSGIVLSTLEQLYEKVKKSAAQIDARLRLDFEHCLCYCAPRAMWCFMKALREVAINIFYF